MIVLLKTRLGISLITGEEIGSVTGIGIKEDEINA